MEDFKENETFALNDRNRYFVVKKLTIENIVFYYTVKMTDPASVVVFADGDELQVVEDEEILKIVTGEVLKSIAK